MSHLETIEISVLATVSGGQAQQQQPQQQPDDGGGEQPRTWGQVAAGYAAACVQGAGQSLIFGGKPRNARAAATTAAMGCAMGVGMKVVDDVAGAIGR